MVPLKGIAVVHVLIIAIFVIGVLLIALGRHQESRGCVTVSKTELAYLVYSPTCGYYKIGYSSNVLERINRLGTTTPGGVILIATYYGGRELEQKLHRQLKEYRCNGEWFYFGDHDAPSLVDSIAKGKRCQISLT